MIDYDIEIAAGIYAYAIEELGKLQVLKNSQRSGHSYIIDYFNEFREHKVKFAEAKYYLEQNGHPEGINIGGSLSKKSFSDMSFTLELETGTEARLGIFYVDFEFDKTTDTANKIREIPNVDEGKLKAAINGLEDVLKVYT